MDNQLSSDLSLAFARGDVALWLGPQWANPTETVADRIRAVDWLGIWIETPSAGLIADVALGGNTRSGRLVIEVADRIEDVLGKHFSISDVCPHFYLNGRGDGAGTLSTRLRRIARDEKVQQLARLKTSTLIIAGYEDEDALFSHLEEIDEAAPSCRQIVITGVEQQTKERLLSRLNPRSPERFVASESLLHELLSSIDERRTALPAAPSIRVGKESVPLDRLLRAEPPIDQDFVILTEQDIRDPDPGENDREMLAQLLSGTMLPWRALAHQLDWQRPLPHRREVLNRLGELRGSSTKVSCLNIPAEAGAGLTTLLHQIACDAAHRGVPVLIHRPYGEFDYDRLRWFLTSLNSLLDGRGASGGLSVVIFDGDSIRADTTGQLRTIAARLARDGERVMLIRGIPLQSLDAFNNDFRRLHSASKLSDVKDERHAQVKEEWMPPIPASLDTSQQRSLLEWASSRLERIGEKLRPTATHLIHSWEYQAGDVPLLIFLYAILFENLAEAAGLGRHLTEHLFAYMREEKMRVSKDHTPDDKPLSGDSLRDAVARLQIGLGRSSSSSGPTADDLAAVFITLAAMGCLRLGIPRGILKEIASLESNSVFDVVRVLEGWNLANTNLPPLQASNGLQVTLAPSAFYNREETIGILHPTYGRLILEWLKRPEAIEQRQLLSARGLTDRFLDTISNDDALRHGIPVQLLKPVFSALRPTSSHVRFAEDVAMRYLRLQKGKKHEEISEWQWKHTAQILDAFSWLNEQVVRQSASLLHSRGISRYKSCSQNLSLPEQRERYASAEDDFLRAIALADDGGSERPVHIMSSLGLLYLGWLSREREAGNTERAKELDRKVEETLRAALTETPEKNPYAVYGLAKYLVSRYQLVIRSGQSEQPAAAAADLAEAIELLQVEPEPYFEDEWNELRRDAFGLLEDTSAQRVIDQLKQDRNELGYALEALRVLHGNIPDARTEEPSEVALIREAAAVLRLAEDRELKSQSHLADLLRYAIFSAEPERLRSPAYRTRHDLLSRLIGSRYLDTAVWLFDYAMLCFQVGQYAEGADAFSRLRKGKRFFEVSRDRACWLTENVDSLKPLQVFLRIISVEGPEGKAWGRVEHPRRFRDPVPLSIPSFRSRGLILQVGHSFPCQISLRPAGPFAEPVGIREA